MMKSNILYTVATLATVAMILGACGGGSDPVPVNEPDVKVEPMDTVYEAAKKKIAAATTAEEAQAAYDAVDQTAITGAQQQELMAALNARLEAIQDAARQASQKELLTSTVAALVTTDLTTPEAIAEATTAINALQAALEAAVDVSDADKEMYQAALDMAVEARDNAQGALDLAGRQDTQRTTLDSAVATARAAVNAVSDNSTDAQVMLADNALATLKAAIDGAEDLPEGDAHVGRAQGTLTTLRLALAAAKESRNAELQRRSDAEVADMTETARKLYAGIGNAPLTMTGDGARNAAYSGTNDADITITMDDAADGDGTDVTQVLKATMKNIGRNHGWMGKQYVASGTGVDGTYEAVVYSNVEAPKQGRKFGSRDAVTTTGAFEYQLENGALALTSGTNDGKRVAFTGVTRTAGTEMFSLPDPNPSGATTILIPGSYHGVSGTYNCKPADAAAGCSAAVAAKGFTVSSDDTWTFTPSNANARVMDAADTAYASFGWWLKKTENDATYTASAFVDEKGTVNAASGLNDLNGTATYQGGAAGQYALHSDIGGTNDAGKFTARVTLEADFTNNTAETAITGTVDNFMGADGQSRDWSVTLNGSQIGDDGEIGNASASTGVDTVWSIGDNAAAASGQWSGSLLNQPTDGVPQVATGTFYTTYGNDGRMVGAFGANKQ